MVVSDGGKGKSTYGTMAMSSNPFFSYILDFIQTLLHVTQYMLSWFSWLVVKGWLIHTMTMVLTNFIFLRKSFFWFIFLIFIYFWETERQCESGGGAEREWDTEPEAGSRLWAVSTEPDMGLEPTNCEIMTGAEVRRSSSTDWATQAPQFLISICNCSCRIQMSTSEFSTSFLSLWLSQIHVLVIVAFL